MNVINPPELGTPIAAYSHGVGVGDLLFVAGQVALAADGSIVGPGDLAAQTRQTIANVEAVLRAGGATLADVASTTVYLTSFENYAEYDRVYGECFGDHRPARATVRADLVKPELLIEIQAVAARRR
jgi:2-iminobutanoate/2-iminopropanoate deaminase